jgi:hypothetical protein
LFANEKRRFLDICPNYNSTLGINAILAAGSTYFPWPNCASYLQEVNCGNLGYVAPLSTGVLFAPTNTPEMGTQTLFDEPGEVTAPPSGALFSWTGFANTWTVTALSAGYYVGAASTGAGGATSTGAGGATSTGAGGATVIGGDTVTGALGGSTTASGVVTSSAGSVSGSGSSSSTKKNAAQCLQPSVLAVFGPFIALGFYLFL